jgi:hypothetical protein
MLVFTRIDAGKFSLFSGRNVTLVKMTGLLRGAIEGDKLSLLRRRWFCDMLAVTRNDEGQSRNSKSIP